VAVPAQPVGGAGHDVQQAPLGDPLADRRLQRQRRAAAVFALAALERRAAALVDGQVDVVRVAGVDPVGDDGQFAAELGDERAMVGGDAGLGAVVSHQRLTLAPAHELVVEVGVSVGADHGDVAGAKLGGQGAEDAHLKVAAVQPAGLAAAAQDLLPLL
jgi:hypothetical protein